MANAIVIIDQAGLPAGVPGAPREDLALFGGANPVVLTNGDDVGVVAWAWTLVDRPNGSAAVLATPATLSASFNPDVEGSYLIRLVTRDAAGEVYTDETIGAVVLPVTGWRIPAAWETTQFHATRGWAEELDEILRAISGGVVLFTPLQNAYDDGAAIVTDASGAVLVSRGLGTPNASGLLALTDADVVTGRTAALLSVDDANVVGAGTPDSFRVSRSVAGSRAVRVQVLGAGDVVLSTGLVAPSTTAVLFGDGDMVLGGSAMVGGEKLRVVGDARVEGKLTVTGAIDPTDITLSGGGTAHFMEWGAGSTAAQGGAGTMRLRYNEGAPGTAQVSLNGGAYADLASVAGITLDAAYDGGGAGLGRTVIADSGAVVINNAVADATNTLELTRTVGTGAALAIGGVAGSRHWADGDTALGGSAMVGTERLRVVGDARVEGGVALAEQAGDPANAANLGWAYTKDVAGETELFYESNDASVTQITSNGALAVVGFVPTTRNLTAGDGLTGGGDLSADRTFTVGAGTGITVNVDDVAVNQAYAFAWTSGHTWTSTNPLDTGIELLLVHDSVSPQSGDYLGDLVFRARNDAAVMSEWARLRAEQTTVVFGGATDASSFAFSLVGSGTLRSDFLKIQTTTGQAKFVVPLAAGATCPFVFTASGGSFAANAIFEINDDSTNFQVFGDGTVSAGTGFSLAGWGSNFVDSSGIYLLRAGADVAGVDSRILRFTGRTSGGVRNITALGEFDEFTDTYRLSVRNEGSVRMVSFATDLTTVQGTTVGDSAPELRIAHLKAQVGTANNAVGRLSFWGPDDNGAFNSTLYGELRGVIHSAVDTAESGRFEYYARTGGTLGRVLSLRGASAAAQTGAVFESSIAVGATVPFTFTATAGNFGANAIFEINDNSTNFQVYGNGLVNSGAAGYSLNSSANVIIDSTYIYRRSNNAAVPGSRSELIRFTGTVVGPAQRNIDQYLYADAGTDTYRMLWLDNGGNTFLSVEADGTLGKFQRTANSTTGPEVRLFLDKTAVGVNNDIGGTLSGYGKNGAGATIHLGSVVFDLSDAFASIGRILFQTNGGAGPVSVGYIDSTTWRFNSAITGNTAGDCTFGNVGAGPLVLSTSSVERMRVAADVATLTSYSATATGQELQLYQDSASPLGDTAPGDNLGDNVGLASFYGEDNGSVKTLYAQIRGHLVSPASPNEEGALDLLVTTLGASTRIAQIRAAGIQLDKVSAVAGADSRMLRFVGQTSVADRVMDVLIDAAAGSDTYTWQVKNNGGTPVLSVTGGGMGQFYGGMYINTGTYQAPSGLSTTVPQFVFEGDLTTGIGHPVAGSVNVICSGVERARFAAGLTTLTYANDAAPGPVLKLAHTRTNVGALNDEAGKIEFWGWDATAPNGVAQQYGSLVHLVQDPANGGEDSYFKFQAMGGGTLRDALEVWSPAAETSLVNRRVAGAGQYAFGFQAASDGATAWPRDGYLFFIEERGTTPDTGNTRVVIGGDGSIQFSSLGTAGATPLVSGPMVCPIGDRDTGIFWPGADQFGISLGGSTVTPGLWTFQPTYTQIKVTGNITAGPELQFRLDKTGAVGAVNDSAGSLTFYATDNAGPPGNATYYGGFNCVVSNAVNGSEAARLDWYASYAGAVQNIWSMAADATTYSYTTAGTTGPELKLLHNKSVAGANGDIVARFSGYGKDSAGGTDCYGKIDFVAGTATAGGERGKVNIYGGVGAGFYHLLDMDFAAMRLMDINTIRFNNNAADANFEYNANSATDAMNLYASGYFYFTLIASVATITSYSATDTGQELQLYQDSASPFAADKVGLLSFYGRDADATPDKTLYAQITGIINTTTQGSECGELSLTRAINGAQIEFMRGGIVNPGAAAALSFFGVTPVTRTTIGADLTNNVTVGGVDNTIADIAIGGSVGADIRNALYQLARSVKILQDSYRDYGLGT